MLVEYLVFKVPFNFSALKFCKTKCAKFFLAMSSFIFFQRVRKRENLRLNKFGLFNKTCLIVANLLILYIFISSLGSEFFWSLFENWIPPFPISFSELLTFFVLVLRTPDILLYRFVWLPTFPSLNIVDISGLS